MIISNTILIICGLLLLLAIVPPFFNPFFRRITISDDNTNGSETQDLPPVSIIITAHDNAAEIRRNLPLILSQQYPTDFQVIVVAEKGDSETEDILKQLAVDKHLYYTLLPESSRYMSRKKLAITLGVKAAKNEWILLLEPSSKPTSEHWLSTMARNCKTGIDLVIGYSRYDEDAHLYQRFERFQTECYALGEAQHHIAYRNYGSNIMIRKSQFMDMEGFRSSLHLVRGEYDFLVNDIATSDNTATELSPLAHICDDAPTHKAWIYQHMYYLESRKELQRSFRHRLTFNIDQTLLHLSTIAIVSGIIASAIMATWIVTIVASLSLICTMALRTYFMAKRLKTFDEHIPCILAMPLQLAVVWHNIKYAINHKFADKLDFTTHKL